MKKKLLQLLALLALCFAVGGMQVACGPGGGCQAACQKQADCDENIVGDKGALISLCTSLCNQQKDKCPDFYSCLSTKTECSELSACGSCKVE